MIMGKKLRKCPFCGHKGKLFAFTDEGDGLVLYDVGCETIGCFLEFGAGWRLPRKDAIRMWNTHKKKKK